MQSIRAGAAAREKEKRLAEDRLNKAKNDMSDLDGKGDAMGGKRDIQGRRWLGKQSQMSSSLGDGSMELDDPITTEEPKGRGSKRKM